jgi:hypothetical protein
MSGLVMPHVIIRVMGDKIRMEVDDETTSDTAIVDLTLGEAWRLGRMLVEFSGVPTIITPEDKV